MDAFLCESLKSNLPRSLAATQVTESVYSQGKGILHLSRTAKINDSIKAAYHFIHLCTVILLNVSQDSDVIALHKVDSHTLQGEPGVSVDELRMK